MAGEKLSSRQQMIGMMYLVLLAMLAMNASKDLLNAFIFLEDGINVTTKNFNNTNSGVYNKIQQAAATGANVAVIANKNAAVIQQKSNDLYNLLQTYKSELIELGGGLDEETQIPVGKDNQDIGAEYLITEKKGEELKLKILEYKNILLYYINPEDSLIKAGIIKLLQTPEHKDYEGVTSPWENGISEYLPLAAVTANLSNLQSYIRNAESQTLNYLYENLSIDAYKVNKIKAATIAQSGYVLQGENYNANIFLAASDTTQEPIIIVGDYDTAFFNQTGSIKFTGTTDTLPVNGGVGQYKLEAQNTGNFNWGGIIKVPHPNPKRKGEYLVYPFTNNYTVAQPNAVISSDQLNIMYKGLKNEISISAAGMQSDNLVVTATNCIVSATGNGKYVFTPNKTGRIIISVSAKVNGHNKLLSTQTWKSVRLPKPLVEIPGVRNGQISASTLAAILTTNGVVLKYDPSFPISTKPQFKAGGIEAQTSNGLTSFKLENKKLSTLKRDQISGLSRGSKVFFSIKAKGADGITHNMTTTVKIK